MLKFPRIAVKNSLSTGNVLELQFLDYIYDTFDWGTWTEIRMVQDVINKVQATRPSEIVMIIDSEGGDCGIGMAIYNYLSKYKADNNIIVSVDVLSMAGSIASVMAMTASPGKLRMARNSFMVIHRAWGSGYGNSEDLRAAANVIDAYTAQIVDIYAQRTGKSVDDINALIATGDYWMSATEAIEQSFADAYSVDNTSFNIAARIGKFDPHYTNVPSNLVAQETEVTEEQAQEFLNQHKNIFMKFKNKVSAFLESLKKKPINQQADDLALEVANVISEPMSILVEGLQEEVQNEINGMENKIKDSLTTDLTASITEKVKADLSAIYDGQIAALKKQNEDLQEEIANKIGKESGNRPAPENKTIGFYTGRKTEEE